MGDTSRESVSREQLLAIMNEELAKHGVCEDCQIDGPIRLLDGPIRIRLQEADETGCNWSEDVTTRCSGRSVTRQCYQAVGRVVADARRRYNIQYRKGDSLRIELVD